MPGLMSRDREPERPVPRPVPVEPPLFIGERCDRCGATPRFRVGVPLGSGGLGELYFCTHHYEKLLPALSEKLGQAMTVGVKF